MSPIQTRRGTNIVAEAQSPKTRSRRCCETMIFVPSSFIRLSEPISRGTVTGQRNSRTRLRASCPTSRTSEHSRAGARRCDVQMFGCLPLDGPHREGGLLAGLRTYLPLSRTNLTQQFLVQRPKISAIPPSGIANSARDRRLIGDFGACCPECTRTSISGSRSAPVSDGSRATTVPPVR